MALPILSIVRRALSQRFPPSVDLALEFLRQEIYPVLKDLRNAFNSLAGPEYNFGTLVYGEGVPVGAPFSDRAIYIDKTGGAGTTVYDWNGTAWELMGGGGGGTTIDIDDEGVLQGAVDEVNFVGAGVTATVAGTIATVTIPGGAGVSPATTVVTETAFGQGSAVGVAVTYAREDHTHGTPAAPAGGTPSATVTNEVPFNLAQNAGAAVEYSRGDHTHGSPPFLWGTADFGSTPPTPAAVVTTVADAGVVGSSVFALGVHPTAGRATDEMELGPVVAGIGNIIDNVSFDVIVVSLDGDATGSYTFGAVRYNHP